MDLFERLVGTHITGGAGDRVSYVDPDLGEVTYARLARAVRRYAAVVAGHDLVPGTRAMVVADDSVATIVAILGLWSARMVPVPVSPLLTDAELAFIATDCAAGFGHLDGPAARRGDLDRLFLHLPTTTGDGTRDLVSSSAAQAEAPPADWRPPGEVLVQYTSGSTGVPKGVLHGRAGLDAVLAGFGSLLQLGPGDTVLSTAKLSFGYGFGNSLLFPLAAGARTVLIRGPVDPHRLGAALADTRPTVLCSVPRMYRALTDLAPAGPAPDLGSLRLAVSAGEHLPAELHARFEDVFGVPLVNGLGATEVLHIVVTTRPQGTEKGSTGWPVAGVTATIRDRDGQVVTGDREGRLHIAGASVALGYLDRPEQTAATFADGGAYTSDIVRRGEAGDIRYVCRADDMLNIGGYMVSPLEIETVVRQAPGVADCAVVGHVDEAGLEQAVAYVVATPDADREQVRLAVQRGFRSQLAPFKRPSRVDILDALPTTSTGKLARFQLRAPASQVTTTILNPAGERTLVCVPFAGGTAHAFARLARCLAPDWTVVTGQASYRPGATLDAAAEVWWQAVREHVRPGTVLFGHSAGAAIVAEIALRYRDRLAGVRLVVSAPPVTLPAAQPDEEVLLDSLAGSGLLPGGDALPGGSLTSDELRRLVLPQLANDLLILRNGWKAEPPGRPVHVLIGSEDPTCSARDLAVLSGWDIASVDIVPGAHLFCVHNPQGTASVLREIAGRP